MVTPDNHAPSGVTAALQADWERRVLRGLLAEWESAWWLLPEPIRRCVRKPFFTLEELPGRLGCWKPGKREISLNREIVNTHRWDDVKEILLHEMAHQVAHEGLKATVESDHGDRFRQACRLLGANPAASGTYPTLHARLHCGEVLSDQDRIMVKIHKLMALAESNNPNEAHAAMCKAYELITRYHLDQIECGAVQEYTSIFLGKPRLRHFREAYHLAHLLQNYYFVQGMWIRAWVMEKCKMGRVLEISGSRTHVQIAQYVHDTICRYVNAAWVDYGGADRLNRYRKTDFAVGVIEGFATTLDLACAPGAGTDCTRLPIRLADPALTCYMGQRYPHVRAISRRGPQPDAHVLADGRASGRKLVIAKGITRKAGFTNQLLE